jgi:predicted RNase H-like HicB family nuclease
LADSLRILLERIIMKCKVLILQDEDGNFCVSVPQLKGCHSHGTTRDEALTNIREAIELYLEDFHHDLLPDKMAGVEVVEIEL